MSELTDGARERTRNTFIQGLIATVLVSGLTALSEWLASGDFTWRTLGVSAATACTTAVVTYLQHSYVAPYRAIRKGE